uniref:Uncharacterized protein n=1 Tax=Anguilla anguilla TaxID=7936 RepID=A0A0E9S8F9_ANGAN
MSLTHFRNILNQDNSNRFNTTIHSNLRTALHTEEVKRCKHVKIPKGLSIL